MSFFSLQGTFKDKVTQVFAWIMAVITVIQIVQMVWAAWLATASASPTVAEYIQLAVTLAVTLVAHFTGKDGNGQPKVVA